MGKPLGCRICGRRLSFHQQVSGQLCDNWRCKSELLETDLAAYRGTAARAVGIRRPDTYAMVVVPESSNGTGRQPQSRIQAHINFLFDLCLKTDTNEDDGAAIVSGSIDLDPPDEIESRVCGICKGSCCHLGREHAFQNASSIRRFMRFSGLRDPMDIVYAYFANLPSTAAIDGCVYQTDHGCTLPRWMRGDMCNAYRCKGLSQIGYLIRYNGASRAFVVVRRDNRILRGAFVQRHRIRPYPLPGRAVKEAASLSTGLL